MGAITAGALLCRAGWVVNVVFPFLHQLVGFFLDMYSFLLVSVCVFLKNTTKGCNFVPIERVFLYFSDP